MDDYIREVLSKYPYKTKRGIPFRLVRLGESSWDVFEYSEEVEYGVVVDLLEKHDTFDGYSGHLQHSTNLGRSNNRRRWYDNRSLFDYRRGL